MFMFHLAKSPQSRQQETAGHKREMKKKHEDNESKSLKKKENELRTIFYAG